jgi:hypothetical protein
MKAISMIKEEQALKKILKHLERKGGRETFHLQYLDFDQAKLS